MIQDGMGGIRLRKLNRSEAVIYGSGVAYLAASAVFLLRPFELPASLVRIAYPQSGTLSAYCSSHACLYSPMAVASLYSLQAVLFFFIAILLYLASRKHTNPSVDGTVTTLCLLVVIGTVVDYWFGNFSFDKVWILPNNITDSSLGVFRYAIMFWLATVAALIMSNIISPEEARNATR